MDFRCSEKLVTMRRWKIHAIFATRIDSLALTPLPPCMGIRVTPRPSSSLCAAAEKNGLRPVWTSPFAVLRSTSALDSRSLLWRQTRLPLLESATRPLLEVRQSKDRAPRLGCRTVWLPPTVRLLGGATLPRYAGESGSRGVGIGLADGQSTGKTVHARATSPRAARQSQGHRHRRNLHGQG